MKAKRFILMLLVMLGSVTGAWAQEPTKLHLTHVGYEGNISRSGNAFDGDLTTRTDVTLVDFDSDLPNPYITFKTDFPVRVDLLSIHYENDLEIITGFELKGLKNEEGNWDTQSTSMLQETNLGKPTQYVFDPGIPMFVHGPFNITCNPEDRYQYFRIYFNSISKFRAVISEIELYVTCDHSYPAGTNVCSKCGYKDESVLHEHVYSSDWSYDKDGHWQACSGTVGICNSPRRNYASHSSGLTCSVCGMPHCHQLDDAGSCRVDGCGYSVSSISQDLFEALETYGGSSSSSFNNLGKLFDGNTDTKWQAGVKATAIFKTQIPVRIDGYSFHSVDGNYYGDWLHPHPKSWTLYGYDETANTWQIVHSVIDASPSNGWNNYRFLNNDGPHYSYYKLEITKLQNDHPACNTNIGGLTLDIIHEHNYEWVVDEHHHKQVCTSKLGTCTAPRIDEAEHSYGSSITDDAINYTCESCGYVDEERKAQFEARDYMSMTAVGGDVKIGATMYQSAESDYVLQYSKDRVNWSNYAVKNNNIFVTIRSGETYYFRSGMPELLTGVMDENTLWNFTMEGNGTIEAGGNTMSLLDRSCQSLTVGKDGFDGLFFECTLLTVAPELPATELDEYCYCSMFYGCNKLRKAPHLPAKTIKYASYDQMFYKCSSLEYVEADFTEASPGGEQTERTQPFYNATDDWLYETAPNGIVVLKREMIEKRLLYSDKIDIPSRWQRALMVKANEDPDHRGNFYTTFYDNKYSFNVIGDAKAYSGSIESDELRLTATNGNVIPKGDGVLLHGPSAEMVLAINGGSNQISGNVLTGSDTDTTAPANCYILSYGQNGLGFYQYAQGKTLSAHKAYLTYERPAGAQARALRMVFADGEVDGIENVNVNENENVSIYSLSGIRLNKLQKGINIVNGKKIIVK